MLSWASVYCSLVVTCWERVDLLPLVWDVLLWVCYFPIGILGQVWYLIISIPDIALFRTLRGFEYWCYSKNKLTSSIRSSAGGITLDLRSLWYLVIINLSTGVIPLRETPESSVMHNVCPCRFLNSSVHVSCNNNCNIYSTTKETYMSFLRQSLRNEDMFYTIFFNNQLCIKLLNNVTGLLKPVHAVHKYIDKGSFLKMTSVRLLVFTRVLVLIRSLRPISGMSLSDEAIECMEKPKQTA